MAWRFTSRPHRPSPPMPRGLGRRWRGPSSPENERVILKAPGDSLASSDLELLWKFRHALTGEKKALQKFLLSSRLARRERGSTSARVTKAWTRIDVADAIKLLGPDQAYQRSVVRGFAVDALRQASDMELVTYLLQLVQALRYDEKDEKGRVASACEELPLSARQTRGTGRCELCLVVFKSATDEQSCACIGRGISTRSAPRTRRTKQSCATYRVLSTRVSR